MKPTHTAGALLLTAAFVACSGGVAVPHGTGGTGGAGGAGGVTTSTTNGTGGVPDWNSNSSGVWPPCFPNMSQHCYSGPAGTDGVGLCHGGTQTCASDGSMWGPCMGEVTPQAEDCATPADEDCSASGACTGLVWAKRFGTAGGEKDGNTVAMNDAGEVALAGSFTGSLDFGGGPLAVTDGGFLAKLGPGGQHQWSKGFGKASIQSVSFDASGGMALAGSASTVIDFGGVAECDTLTQGQGFWGKLDAQGNYVWARCVGGSGGSIHVVRAAATPDGRTVVVGSFSGTIDFGTGPLTSALSDLFFALYSSTGMPLYAFRSGGPGGAVVQPFGLAVDADGSIAIAGALSGTADFGGGPLTATTGGDDIFVLKLNATGWHLWSRIFGDASQQWATGVAIDPKGRVLVTGFHFGSVDFGGGPLTSHGDKDIFLASFNGGGGSLWSRSFGTSGPESGQAVACDAHGVISLFAQVQGGGVDFGGGASPMVTGQDIALARFDATGLWLSDKNFGSGTPRAIAAQGEWLAMTGTAYGPVDFGGGPLTNNANLDVLGAVIAP